ncbi:SH3 domain protein [Dictyocaulus viviparus]|uniref:SH3 domain protein n=1 Tax=Dictyocaulus viviparus TaxID=29172 RepID=A0A0D8Y156_DICVI|nr:SH3 domain protein [Dictyocaulus viviparus]
MNKMHTIARENLQHFLYAYKESPKEPGLRIVYDARKSHAQRKQEDQQLALEQLRATVNLKVAFAVRANTTYDGALEDESPIQKKTVSFKKGDFLHIYKRYSPDWWIGRVVSTNSTIGFIPTARRLARLVEQNDDEQTLPGDKNALM